MLSGSTTLIAYFPKRARSERMHSSDIGVSAGHPLNAVIVVLQTVHISV